MKYSAYRETFVHQLNTEELTRIGRLANEVLPADVAEAVIKHIDNFADYSDDTIWKIVESGCNADRILTKIDEYGKDFAEDLTAGQLKRVDDILEQGITPEQFEVLLDHADNLENYTDEVVELWRNYGGDSEEFLKLVDEFGEDFVEAFDELGEDAVKEYKELLEGRLESLSTPSSKVLRSNLIESGVEVPDYPNAAHHIVAGGSPKAAEARTILQKYGVDINDAANGVFLPTVKDVSEAAYHPSLHTNAYYDKVNNLLSTATSKEDVLDILDSIAEELKDGTFMQ